MSKLIKILKKPAVPDKAGEAAPVQARVMQAIE